MSQFSVGIDATISGNSGSVSLPATIETVNTTIKFVGLANTLTEDFSGDSNNNILIGSTYNIINPASNNVCMGALALRNLTTGSGNIAIGNLAGAAYNGSESSNICLGNTGELGDTGITRLGTSLSALCYVYGNLINLDGRRYNITVVDDPEDLPYTIGLEQHVIAPLPDLGDATFFLPASPPSGTVIIVKSVRPGASLYTITITTSDGSKIDGQDSYLINTEFGSVQLLFCQIFPSFGAWGTL